ncbi:MAG: Fis family transcriptional regulator [Gemmatimonadetes bacterium]|nr:Fis family transcriptional regulator [Gemmatimonadota bacterium]
MSTAFSEEWAKAWGAALNASPEYQAAAATWEGSIAAVATDDAAPAAVFLDVWHGECRTARAATPDDVAQARFLLEAAPRAWRDLFEGRLAPVMGLMTGRIKVTRGELAALLPYTAAAKELIRLAGSIPTVYPDGW